MSEPTAFPLDESKLPFKIPKDTKPREKIMKLGQMITDRVPAKLRRLTVEDPEYWGLASIVTDEMADVALKMKVRQPMTLPELEKATGKPLRRSAFSTAANKSRWESQIIGPVTAKRRRYLYSCSGNSLPFFRGVSSIWVFGA